MKKLTKAMLATGGALLLGAGAVANYLMAQQPRTAQEELTLANLEAMASLDPDELDLNPDEEQKNIYSYREWFSEDCYVLVGGAYAKGKKVTCFSGTEHPVCVDCKL